MSIWLSLFKLAAHEVVSSICREGVKMGRDKLRDRQFYNSRTTNSGKPDDRFNKTPDQAAYLNELERRRAAAKKADGSPDMRFKCNW